MQNVIPTKPKTTKPFKTRYEYSNAIEQPNVIAKLNFKDDYSAVSSVDQQQLRASQDVNSNKYSTAYF